MRYLIVADPVEFFDIPFQGAVDMVASQGNRNPVVQPAARLCEESVSVLKSRITFTNLPVYDFGLPGDGFLQLQMELGLIIGEPDDYIIVVPAERCLRLDDDLFVMVVQVMQFIKSRQFLPHDGLGPVEEIFCAAGDAMEAGGFLVRLSCTGMLLFGNGYLFSAPCAKILIISERGTALRTEAHESESGGWGDKGWDFSRLRLKKFHRFPPPGLRLMRALCGAVPFGRIREVGCPGRGAFVHGIGGNGGGCGPGLCWGRGCVGLNEDCYQRYNIKNPKSLSN